MLASHMALPRIGHLYAVIRIFAYLEKKHNSRIIFDPSYPEIDMSAFQKHDWKAFYGDVKEAIPPNAPPPRGKSVVLRGYCDSDHAGDARNRRSRTGFYLFLNMGPIMWNSKKQLTVESSTFGAEFTSLKIVAEANRGFRYKLRMMGVPIDGPTYVYGDNMSVLHNVTKPESTLKKKSQSISYHYVRESVAMEEMNAGYVSTKRNISDPLTKILPGGERRDDLLHDVLWDLT